VVPSTWRTVLMNDSHSELAIKIRKATSRAERLLLLQQAEQPTKPQVSMALPSRIEISDTYIYAVQKHLQRAEATEKEFEAARKAFEQKVKQVRDLASRARDAQRELLIAMNDHKKAMEKPDMSAAVAALKNAQSTYTSINKDRDLLREIELTLPN
jgi:hypothetical protein